MMLQCWQEKISSSLQSKYCCSTPKGKGCSFFLLAQTQHPAFVLLCLHLSKHWDAFFIGYSSIQCFYRYWDTIVAYLYIFLMLPCKIIGYSSIQYVSQVLGCILYPTYIFSNVALKSKLCIHYHCCIVCALHQLILQPLALFLLAHLLS